MRLPPHRWRLTLGLLALLLAGCESKRPPELQGIVFEHALAMEKPVTADFNGMIVYRGTSVSTTPKPGQPFKLAHLWEVLSPPGRGWKVRVTLEAPGQPPVVSEHEGAHGAYPIARWERGDIVRDENEVMLPASWSAPSFAVIVAVVNGPGVLPILLGPKRSETELVAAGFPVELTPP